MGEGAVLNMAINDSLRSWAKKNWFPSFSSSPEGSHPHLLVTSAVEFIKQDADKGNCVERATANHKNETDLSFISVQKLGNTMLRCSL